MGERLLNLKAVLHCAHESGLVGLAASQRLVRIDGAPVLVETDPEQRPIAGCPNTGPAIKPCTGTLKVTDGYSNLVRIGKRRVCLETVTGVTDGTPPGTVPYRVRHPGQDYVSEA